VALEGSSELLSNCDFTAMAWDSAFFITAESASNCLIVNNFFHDQDNSDAMGYVWGVNITIRGNISTNCQNSRYDLVHADFIQNWANTSSSVASNVVVEQNLVINGSLQCFMLNAANTGVSQSPNMGNWVIRNNIFANCPAQSGFIDMPNVSVYNNIFYNWGQNNAAAFFVGSGSTTSWAPGDNAIIRNNVFLGCEPPGNIQPTWGWFVIQTGTNTVADHNYFGGIDYSSKSVNEVGMVNGGNPYFVNQGTDFHLLTNSPLRNAGTNLTALFTNDKDGNTRPSAGMWDIGPYEYVSISTKLAPPAPTGLLGVVLSMTNSAPLTIQALGSANWASSLQYNFGDGSYTNFGNANYASVVHTYASPGTYTVTLIASNNVSGLSIPGSQVITVTH
jgi:hypothetical protein